MHGFVENYKILNTPAFSGTTIDTTQAKYTPSPDGGDTRTM